MSRLGNGTGSVYKLAGKRKNPWVARKTVGFKMNGQPIYRYIGYYKTKADAMTALMDYNKAPYSLEKETLESLYDKFIIGYAENHAQKSIKGVKNGWSYLEPLKDKPIASLSRRELQLFFDSVERSKIIKEQIKTVLKHLYDYAIRYDVIQPERVAILSYLDLSSNVEIKRIPRNRFSNEEIEKIKQIDDDMAHTVLFLIYTGLRAGEFCSLTEDSIDKDMIIHIAHSKTAAGIREVPLSEKAKKLLPLTHYGVYDTLRHYYSLWAKKHGFEHNLHCTRYTTISLLVEAGIDDRIIKSIVGHKGKDVTEKVYTKITNEEKKIALDKI